MKRDNAMKKRVGNRTVPESFGVGCEPEHRSPLAEVHFGAAALNGSMIIQ